MKCLLLDKDTKTIVSMVYSMNEILAKEVYLVESLEADHQSLGHMKAIVLARPTAESIKLIAAQLKEPKFFEYHIFFTNIVPQVRRPAAPRRAAPRAGAALTPLPPFPRRSSCASSPTRTTSASCGRCRSFTRTFTR